MPKNLVIVESPTKAKTITKFLGSKYQVESSFGHTRDLPKSKMGVDVEKDFEPKYVIPTKVRKNVNKLKKLAEKSPVVYFATDEDREGEAISWHLAEIFKTPKEKIKRIVFHEITKEAILESLDNPRDIDMNLVDAQQARRILDRLVGYELSPFLWKKVVKGLSAGRVQSVAVRLVVEREREIEAFKPDEYWSIDANFLPQTVASGEKPIEFEAALHKIDNKVVKKLQIKNEKEAKKIVDDLKDAKYSILDITKKETKRSPLAPYTTSTLQQDANRRLGYGPKQTMVIAQQLYEGIKVDSEETGLITYMRTDSVNLADKFLDEAKNYVTENFGKDHAVSSARKFKTKSKSAQEAHEAIRPTSAFRNPDSIKDKLDPRQYKLYKLIWQRAVASQMAEAILDNTTIEIKAGDTPYTFHARGTIIKFDGFLKVWPNSGKEAILPTLKQNDPLDLVKLNSNQHFTKPPARYSEAGLVKVLEEHGIGRPSTYAPTIGTIQTRNYVQKEERRLKPTEIAFLVNDLLVEHFPKIVDYEFTAKMEDDLDEIAEGKQKWQNTIKEFYMPFKKNLEEKYEEVSKKITEEETDEVCEKCKKPMIIKTGRFGKFMACTGFPECKNTKPIDGEGNAKEEKTDEKCKKCGADMVIKHGRFGKFLACSKYPDCKTTKQIVKSTDLKCPKCGKGDIVQKRGRGGRSFYACDQYPDCKNAYWSKPTGKKCPDCESLVVYGANDTERCSNKECKYKADLDKSYIKDDDNEGDSKD